MRWTYKKDILGSLLLFLLPEVTRGVHLNVSLIQGLQGSGKSVFLAWLFESLTKMLDSVDYYLCDRQRDIKFSKDHFDHLIGFEDVIRRGLNARRSMARSNVAESEYFFRVRHACMNAGLKTARINLFYVTQRLGQLDISVRSSAPVVIVKSMLPEEISSALSWMPTDCLPDLLALNKFVYASNESVRNIAKSRSLCFIIPFLEWGVLQSDYSSFFIPEKLSSLQKDYQLFDQLKKHRITRKSAVRYYLELIGNIDSDESEQLAEEYYFHYNGMVLD